MIKDLWGQPIKVINLGSIDFYHDLMNQGVEVINLDWKPAAKGDQSLLMALDKLEGRGGDIEAANIQALDKINGAQPVLIDVQRALDVVPGMTEDTILHAGPPITWARMSGPLRGAVAGALILEGRASNYDNAAVLAASGKIIFAPCHQHNAIGPMAGVISPSMPVFVLENKKGGNRTYSTMNEGLGKVLRYGAYSEEVIDRLNWMRDVLAPGIKKAVLLSGGIDIKAIAAQALHMGDEVHNRNKAATSLFIRQLLPWLLQAEIPEDQRLAIINFINSNDHFYLNLSMASAKAMLDNADGIENCTLLTVMSRNGTDFGIKVSGLPGRWFVAPAGDVKGLLFPGFSDGDKNPDMGDSSITETVGLGGFSMAASIAIVQFVGGTPQDAINYSTKMYRITQGESTSFSIPVLDFRGSPTGIDIRKVVETGILPQINTGIAHREAGVGQVGAGLINPPWDCFRQALLAFSGQED